MLKFVIEEILVKIHRDYSFNEKLSLQSKQVLQGDLD